MQGSKLFELNEIVTLASGISVVASYCWMRWRVPDYKVAHLKSPGPLLGLVHAYRQSLVGDAEKAGVSAIFRIALAVFLVSAVISFGAGFVAAVRGPTKLIQF